MTKSAIYYKRANPLITSSLERTAPVEVDGRSSALSIDKRVGQFTVGIGGTASARGPWRTGGFSVRLKQCSRRERDPKRSSQRPPTVALPVPLLTTARMPEPETRQREDAARHMWTTDMCHSSWGQRIIIVATGMPLRTTGDDFRDGWQ